MLAATVCPWSTLREMTMPSIGARMTVCPRLTFCVFSCDQGLHQSGFRRLDLRLLRLHVQFRRVELGRAESGLLARCCSICGLDQRRVEPGDDLPLLDDRVEVGVQLLTMPDTWVPTSTVSTASSVPVA
jgi:hypothetical protein